MSRVGGDRAGDARRRGGVGAGRGRGDHPRRPARARRRRRPSTPTEARSLPGLHDHHIHLLALAAARRSIRVGPPDVTDAAGLDRALRAPTATATVSGWLRAVGYHESISGDARPPPPRRPRGRPAGPGAARDRCHVGAQLGRRWRRTAIAELDPDGRRTRRRWVADRALLRPRRRAQGARPAGAARPGRRRAGPRPLRGHRGHRPDADGRRSRGRPAGGGRGRRRPADRRPRDRGLGLPDEAGPALPRGAVKFVVGDHRLPALDVLADRHPHRPPPRSPGGRALRQPRRARAGAGGVGRGRGPRRRPHRARGGDPGGAAHPTAGARAGRRDPAVVRARPRRPVPGRRPGRRACDLWRCGSLVGAGVGVAAGTDAPYGDPDPWRAVAAAAERRTSGGAVLGADERIDPAAALGLFLTAADDPAGPVRRIAVGRRARLCVLDRPLPEALAAPEAPTVRAVVGPTGSST